MFSIFLMHNGRNFAGQLYHTLQDMVQNVEIFFSRFIELFLLLFCFFWEFYII